MLTATGLLVGICGKTKVNMLIYTYGSDTEKIIYQEVAYNYKTFNSNNKQIFNFPQ